MFFVLYNCKIIQEKTHYYSNRVIYPNRCSKFGIKVHSFAKSLPLESFDLVTVRNKEYYVYKYVGDLNARKNIAIVLSYPKESLFLYH